MKNFRQILLVAGARPNFMKLAGLYHRLKSDERFDVKICHTGQHFDSNMSDVFWNSLKLPVPDYSLNIRAVGVASTIGETAAKLSSLLCENEFDDVVVFGDVSGTAGAAIAAAHSSARLIHVEAGLRSFDRDMPEELNRITVDHLSDLLLVSEQSGMENLHKEGIPSDRFYLVGNLMIECMLNTRSEWHTPQRTGSEAFGVCTFHRPENVDDEKALTILVDRVLEISELTPLVWPLHPRTRLRLDSFGLLRNLENSLGVTITEPQGYLEFLNLVSASKFVLTDSGGIQEETSYLGKPCITVRKNTERPITLTLGTNRLLSLMADDFVSQVMRHVKHISEKVLEEIPYWDSLVSKRISDILADGGCKSDNK
ncbi:non-hydrolyzing UDP-N-acetylglucosamine 2-epimerase [Alcanivorax sp. 1008]|uniref:non-hydrolyzing UDP-N-acetylglucosamine 2-epimerase n=1 Tax=Alcanivorax sp. 1008 TaxID=2816853 RepID=UPI001DB1815F|nr:UDP-N-acetylglucosamine 2-epimerase (non-hydrolyzing) [Alcanivorax sp. 1008]MCC1498222.1 UDP-N-acetylglucosamine 2-epimerase (non-hydrolyzing) [Alcanivorax sp. 1008]